MSIIISKESRVLVQGITGREGSSRTRFMIDYGTNVVAGVTPGKGGYSVYGVPVFNSIAEAIDKVGSIDVSVIFVPAPNLLEAALESINNKIDTIVIPTERVPLHDIIKIISIAKKKGCRIIGPGSIGVISPGEAVVGWIGGSFEMAEKVFKRGRVGVISRSGGQTTTISWSLTLNDLGISTAIHVGSEAIVGTTIAEILKLFEEDDDTDAIVIFGEVGGVMEEEAAQLILDGEINKPIVAYIVGRGIERGIRYSHSSVLVEGRNDYLSKIEALRRAGVKIADKPSDIPKIIKKLIR